MNEYDKQDYIERQFHRAVLERNNYRDLFWFCCVLAVAGWVALVALAFKAGIIGV